MKSLLTLIAGLLLAASALAGVEPSDALRRSGGEMTGAKTVADELASGETATAAIQDPQGHGEEEHGDQEHGETHHDDGGHGHDDHSKSTMEMTSSEMFTKKYEHLEPHVVVDMGDFTFYDVNLWQLFSVALMFLVFGSVLTTFRTGKAPWLLRVFRGWCHWIRDEVVIEVMGPDEGRRFAPYFIYVFFFIAFANLLGMLPNAVTSTATVFVTVTLAMTTFGIMVGGGMRKHGVLGFWKSLVPHGLPLPLIPLMFVLEVIGLIVKPVALTVRLFANMLAGHLVIYSFIAMIFLFAKMLEMETVAYGPAVAAVGMSVFISIIESFVAILQAYIFTYLSVIFVQQALHPAH